MYVGRYVIVIVILVALAAGCGHKEYEVTDFGASAPGDPPYPNATAIRLGFMEAHAVLVTMVPRPHEHLFVFARDADSFWRITEVASIQSYERVVKIHLAPRMGHWQLRDRPTVYVLAIPGKPDTTQMTAAPAEGKEYKSLPEGLAYSPTVVVLPPRPLLIPISESPLNWRKWIAVDADIGTIPKGQTIADEEVLPLAWWRGGETLVTGRSSISSAPVFIFVRQGNTGWAVHSIENPDPITGEFEAWYSHGVSRTTAILVAAAGRTARSFKRGDAVGSLPSDLSYSKVLALKRE